MMAHVSPNWTFDTTDYRLENAMRIEMIRQFQQIAPTHPQYELVHSILTAVWENRPIGYKKHPGKLLQERHFHDLYRQNVSMVVDSIPLAIQADSDEIPTGLALAHLQYCQLRQPTFPIYAPCVSYKHNIHTLQLETFVHLLTADTTDSHIDNSHVSKPDADRTRLLHYLNDAGPMVDTLLSFLVATSTQRGRRFHLDVHLGLGAALHLSSVQEPGEVWYKAGSTHHGLENRDMWKVMSREFILKGRRSVLGVEDILLVTHMEGMNKQNHVLRKRSMTSGVSRKRKYEGSSSNSSSSYYAPSQEEISMTKTSPQHSPLDRTVRDSSRSGRLHSVRSFPPSLRNVLRSHLPEALKHHADRYPFIAPPL